MRPTTAFDDNVFDITALLHPGTIFNHPRDVVAHPSLSISEKRAILASWASDASAIASCPALRLRAASRRPSPSTKYSKPCVNSTGVRAIRRAASRTVCVRRREPWRRNGERIVDEIKLPQHIVNRIERRWASHVAQVLGDRRHSERAPLSPADGNHDPLQSPQVRRRLEESLRPPTSLLFR